LTLAIFLIRVIELLFFVGLAGCAVVVVVSWFSIFKAEFFDKEDVKIEHEIITKQPTSYRFARADVLESRGLAGYTERQ